MTRVTRPLGIDETILNGVAFDPKNWRAGVATADRVPKAAANLLNSLSRRDVVFAIAGGIAMQAHIDGRNTQDLDLLLAPSELASISGFRVVEQSGDFVLGSFGGLRVDVLVTSNGLFSRILGAYVSRQQFAEGEFPVVTPQGMVILKLYALPSLYRQGEATRIAIYEGDIYALLSAYEIDDAIAIRELRPFVLASDIKELQRILQETRERIARATSRFRRDFAD